MNLAALNQIAEKMVAPGKGLLAADESTGTIKKRFDTIGLTSTEESRRDYREMLFRAKEAMADYISGVILYEETLGQRAVDGAPLVQLIADAGAVPGIKVDKGTIPLPGFGEEHVTEGLDGLRELGGFRRHVAWKEGDDPAILADDVLAEIPCRQVP